MSPSESKVPKAAPDSGCVATSTNLERAEIAISRMSNPEVIRIHLEIGLELMDLDIELADFSLALTGRGATPATVVRRIVRTRR